MVTNEKVTFVFAKVKRTVEFIHNFSQTSDNTGAAYES